MRKNLENSGKRWTDEDINTLRKMAKTRPVGIIAYELKRSEPSVYQKAQEIGISLMPPERSPYGRPKK